QLGGTAGIDSRLGQGTTVSIFLLRAGPSAKEGDDATAPAGPAELPPPRGRRVLLVDDDDAVRTTVAAMLREFGYGVIAVDGADPALAVLDGDDPIDVVVAD